jgi:hypothetical protein
MNPNIDKDNNNFLEELKEYFRTTSKEQILADWEKSKEFDNIGPTVDEFLVNTQKYICWCDDPCKVVDKNICGECCLEKQ